MADRNGSDLFTNIFGTPTQSLRLFSNNAFRRPKPENSDVLEAPPKLQSSTIPSSTLSDRGVSVGVSRSKAEGREKVTKKTVKSSKHSSGSTDASQQEKSFFSENQKNRWDEVSSKKDGSAPKKKQIRSKEQIEKPDEAAKGEIRTKLVKTAFQAVPEQQKPSKRQKLSNSSHSDTLSPTKDNESHEYVLQKEKKNSKRKKDDCSPNLESRMKQSKVKNSLETRYEKKLSGVKGDSTKTKDCEPMSILKEGHELEDNGPGASLGKRKRSEHDIPLVKESEKRLFDTEEKLERTIFVGNLPLIVKKKALIKEFSAYGQVESVRLRSVPLLDTKIPRRGAIIKGQINETVNSQHAYVVFVTSADAKAALAHNMKEVWGNHLRVDAAYAPHQGVKEKASLHYDPKRSIFVGNIPFDVKDEELYQIFSAGKSPESDVEAIRVIRDPQTSISKGIAYVLFKTKAGAFYFLSNRRRVKLRERFLRIHRVLTSQSMNKMSSPSRHSRKREDEGNSLPQKKRAKLSASYEGTRASKQNLRMAKDKQKGAGYQQQSRKRSFKVQSHEAARAVGTKRKRTEKHQRGISRSKKIRRT